jgi:hypothetical protein
MREGGVKRTCRCEGLERLGLLLVVKGSSRDFLEQIESFGVFGVGEKGDLS